MGMGAWVAFADSTAAGLLWALEHLEGPVLHPAVGPLGAAALSLAVVAPRGRWALLLLGLTLRSYGVDRVSFLSVGQGDAALLEVARGCPQLQLLAACCCPLISDGAVRALGAACPNLQLLALAQCPGVSDAGVCALLAAASRLLRLLAPRPRAANPRAPRPSP